MKALFKGMGSYQGSPIADSYLVVTYQDRLEDGDGNASVSQYFLKFDPVAREWRDAHVSAQPLYVPVVLSQTVRVEITEVFRYADRPEVRTTYTGWAMPTNVEGTEFDYTQLKPPVPPTGKEPLTMQAARQLLEEGDVKLAAMEQALADTAQSVALAVSAAGITPVADLAAVPAEPGLYRTMDTGQVWERLAGGTLERRAQLEAAPRTMLPRQTTILSRGSIGQASWDASTAQALADVGPGGVLYLPGVPASVDNPTGAATYVYDAVPDFSDVTVSADPNVTISVPSLNGVTLNDWRLLTPLNVRVRDRPHDVMLVPTATGLDWLAQLAQGSLWHDIGLTRPAPLDGTTLSAVRRYTNISARHTGQVTLAANLLTWTSGQHGGGIDAAVLTNPAPGTHASASLDSGFAPEGRVGVLIEAGTDYLYLSTDAYSVYTGLYSAEAGWAETSKPLPSAAYSAVGTGMPEYAWRIVSDRECEVYINGVEVARYRFTGNITSAGWGVYWMTLDGFNVYARDLVIGTSERAHLGRPVVVGIYSDSVGFGEGLNIGWADAMESALRGEAGISRVTVINRAVSGANSTQQRQRLDADGAVGQTVTVISVGINDQQQFADLNTYRDNLVAMVTRIRADGSIPVLVVPHTYLDKRNPSYGFASSNYAQAGRYHAVVRRVAAELTVICADAAAAVGVVSPDTVYTVTRDNLHPTVQAAVQIGREVARAVMQAITTRVQPAAVAATPAPTPTPTPSRTTVRRTFAGAGTVTVQLPPGVVEVRAGWVWDGTIRSIQVISAISQVGAGGEAKLTHACPDGQLSAALSTAGVLSLSSTVNMPGYVDVTYEVWSP